MKLGISDEMPNAILHSNPTTLKLRRVLRAIHPSSELTCYFGNVEKIIPHPDRMSRIGEMEVIKRLKW